MSDFYQNPPALKNQFTSDPLLMPYLRLKLPETVFPAVAKDLERFGERVVSDVRAMGVASEASPPRHVPFDPWGRRIDEIQVSDGWTDLDRVSAEEGIVAIAYARKEAEWSRLYQFCKLYLYHPSSAFATCPLAMTDGAARALELYGSSASQKEAFTHLTSRDPGAFWTSGQWMTERTGGSDVSGTSTVAKPDGKGGYLLYGTKWFTSATTAQMAMTLARMEGDAEGSRGLSLFFVKLRDSEGKLRNIEIHRLKDKLGTKALPTAELSLIGTPAELVGGPGNGVKKISSLFNITRIYNSICAVSTSQRALALAEDYAEKRVAFGKPLTEHPLHMQTLADMRKDWQASFIMTMELAMLLGREETGKASEQEKQLLRLLTPVAKLYTAKKCISITSEALECFGGAGYVEDTGLPVLLRDAQVLSIWEGTTNVLSLDMLRAIARENAFPAFQARIESALAQEPSALQELGKIAKLFKNPEETERQARSIAFAIAELFITTVAKELAPKIPALAYHTKFRPVLKD